VLRIWTILDQILIRLKKTSGSGSDFLNVRITALYPYPDVNKFSTVFFSVAEPHHFYAAPVKNFDPAPAPTLLYSKIKFLKQTKFKHKLKLSCPYDSV
jgi:hypothetical protein